MRSHDVGRVRQGALAAMPCNVYVREEKGEFSATTARAGEEKEEPRTPMRYTVIYGSNAEFSVASRCIAKQSMVMKILSHSINV